MTAETNTQRRRALILVLFVGFPSALAGVFKPPTDAEVFLEAAPMAVNLLADGHRVRVWNRTAEKLQKLVGLGAEPVAAPEEKK